MVHEQQMAIIPFCLHAFRHAPWYPIYIVLVVLQTQICLQLFSSVSLLQFVLKLKISLNIVYKVKRLVAKYPKKDFNPIYWWSSPYSKVLTKLFLECIKSTLGERKFTQ